jgi:hypothetical protein
MFTVAKVEQKVLPYNSIFGAFGIPQSWYIDENRPCLHHLSTCNTSFSIKKNDAKMLKKESRKPYRIIILLYLPYIKT